MEQGRDHSLELQEVGCLLPGRLSSTRGRHKDSAPAAGTRKVLAGLHVLVLSTEKLFTEDWESVLDSLGESADRYSCKRTFSEVFTIELRRRLQLEPSPRVSHLRFY